MELTNVCTPVKSTVGAHHAIVEQKPPLAYISFAQVVLLPLDDKPFFLLPEGFHISETSLFFFLDENTTAGQLRLVAFSCGLGRTLPMTSWPGITGKELLKVPSTEKESE